MEQEKYTLNVKEYAFNFLYHLSLPQLSDALEELLNDTNLLDKRIKSFEDNYLTTANGGLNAEWTRLDNKREAVNLIKETLINYPKSRSTIEANINNRKFERLEKVDVTILLLGVTEIITRKQDNHAHTIGKYVVLAKRYGSKKTYAFVNGVLDAVYNGS